MIRRQRVGADQALIISRGGARRVSFAPTWVRGRGRV
jgi:hypothetical protein